MILVWPGRSAIALTAIFAAYAVITGILQLVAGIASKGAGDWSRIGHIALGIVFMVGGILAFANLGLTAVSLAVFLGIMVGVLWRMEGVLALSTLSDSSWKVVSVLFAVISIIAGITLLFSPLFGAVTLFWLLGIALVVLGIVNIVRAILFGRRAARALA